MTGNPFRNAIATFDALPDALKPAFYTALNDDWSDLEHNGNPLEHGVTEGVELTPEVATTYIVEWASWMCDESSPVPALLNEPELSNNYKADPADTRELLRRLADAYDLIPFDEPVLSTFGGEKVSEGHFLDIPMWNDFELSDHFAVIVEDDDDNPVTHQFVVEDNVVIYKGRDA